jgi:hypothetical protein
MADQVIAESKAPNLYEYWKSSTVKEEDNSKFRDAGCRVILFVLLLLWTFR